ncbi:hypothetical protein C2G38_2038221 [Gigaspora rosea]|uniref:Uncharacterized protein n=1 Tax=Gigaspora rosea TaxID=44941 RepID=A0A397V4A9_9GLOM|nr:hypothetical protein C2G38_2038221 [Gigaspora rosea]
MSSQRATPSRQNYHRCSATPPRQNYHRRSITPPCHLHQINRNYRTLKVTVIDQFLQTNVLVIVAGQEVPMKKIKSTVESLINEVNKLKSDKATTSNDPSEYVDVDDTETTGIMGTTGLFSPMDNLGFCDLDTDETTVAPCDANETTVTPCNNTNSAIATSSVNPSNKKGKQSKDHNVTANNLRKPSVILEPPSG